MTRLPAVLCSDDLPEAELHAAKLDGELYQVDHCFSPIDEIEARHSRARSVLLSVPLRLIAEQRTAAWIHGAGTFPPAHHQFCADISARASTSRLTGVTVREVVIDNTELIDVGGLRVTTPLRTAVDLARRKFEFTVEDSRVIAELMRMGEFGVAECQEVLERRRNLPNKRIALQRLTEAALLTTQN